MNDSTTKIIKLSQSNKPKKNNNKKNNNLIPTKPVDITNKNSNKDLNKYSNKDSNKLSNKLSNKSKNIKKSSDPNNINNVSIDKKKNLRITETDYERPIITHTEKLSKQQIQKLLEDYEQIKNIDELKHVPIGTHIRYFDKKDNDMKFRTGGVLIVNSGLPDYIILSSGHISWSVQTSTSIFFRRVTLKEYKQEVEKTLLDKQAIINGLYLTINENGHIINELKKKVKYYESLLKKNKIQYTN